MSLVSSEPERVVSTAGAGPLAVYEVDLGNGRTGWFKLTAERADQLGAHRIDQAESVTKARAPSNKRRVPQNKQDKQGDKASPGLGEDGEAGEGVSGGTAGDTG